MHHIITTTKNKNTGNLEKQKSKQSNHQYFYKKIIEMREMMIICCYCIGWTGWHSICISRGSRTRGGLYSWYEDFLEEEDEVKLQNEVGYADAINGGDLEDINENTLLDLLRRIKKKVISKSSTSNGNGSYHGVAGITQKSNASFQLYQFLYGQQYLEQDNISFLYMKLLKKLSKSVYNWTVSSSKSPVFCLQQLISSSICDHT